MKNLTLLDLNGDIGRGAIADHPFVDSRAYLDHMDYLGIERSLVTHVRGRELNSTLGNRVLLNEIASTQGASGRLIPAFTISPTMLYEQGALEELCTQLEQAVAPVLATFPTTCRHPLSHLEPLLAQVERYRPVLLWSTRENPHGEQDFEHLVGLATRFPGIAFVCTKMMWPGFGSVLNAMRQCDNIHVGISWLHTRRTIEMLVREFGADRVLFGTGHKEHYGAAIAALVHADITEADRHRIAHGNLETWLNLDPAAAPVPGGREDKPFWEAVRHGGSVEAAIVDAHGHIGATNVGFYQPEIDIGTTARDTIGQMDRLGIDKLIISSFNALFGDALGGNRELARELAPFGDRFAGYAVFNPRYADELVAAFDDLFESGFFVGFKVLSAYWKVRIDDPAFEPMLRYADAHRLPILYHTWEGGTEPRLLADAARKHPHAIFLLGHAGGGSSGRREAIELANASPNVYLEFCGSFTADYPWDRTFDEVGYDRVVFGSDGGGMHDQAWELGRLLSQPVPDEVLRPVLGTTMQGLLDAVIR